MRLSFLCTAKLRKELGIKDKELAAVELDGSPLSAWYADLFRIGSKKSLIFVHPETRYILVALDRKRSEIREIPELFRDLFERVFRAEGVEERLISDILGDSGKALILKTADKSVIGTMTEMVRTIRWELESPEDVTRDREVALSLKLSDTPIGSLKYHLPFQKMTELLREHYGFTGYFTREMEFLSPVSEQDYSKAPLPEGVTSLRAERLWRSFSKAMQRRVLQNVWCRKCSTSREMVDHKLLIREDMVMLEGSCVICGGRCVRVLEEP